LLRRQRLDRTAAPTGELDGQCTEQEQGPHHEGSDFALGAVVVSMLDTAESIRQPAGWELQVQDAYDDPEHSDQGQNRDQDPSLRD
jgi:hypothetical protein